MIRFQGLQPQQVADPLEMAMRLRSARPNSPRFRSRQLAQLHILVGLGPIPHGDPSPETQGIMASREKEGSGYFLLEADRVS